MSEPRKPSGSHLWFYIFLSLLPIAYVRGIGLGYLEPKRMLLIPVCLVCLLALLRKLFIKKQPLMMSGFVWGMTALLVVRIMRLYPVHNFGFQFEDLSSNSCIIILALYALNSDIDITSLGRALILPVCVVLGGAFLKILLGISLFPSPYAIFVNFKNSVPIFLVAAVPFLMVALPGFWEEPADRKKRLRHGVPLFLLMTLIFWVAFCYRTRSSWWMIFSYVLGLGFIYLRTRQPGARRLLLLLLGAAALALILLKGVPNVMVWRSGTPYFDSLLTMASLEKSSGRKELWLVVLHMIRSHPLGGVGTGAFFSQWMGYIAGSGMDPKVFALLTRISPAFNDYLHVTAEIGILPGLLWTGVALGLPLLYIWRLVRKDSTELLPELLLCLASLAIALDALFDFALHRPETYTLHALALSLAARRCGGTALSPRPYARAAAAFFAALFGAVLLTTLTMMSVGVVAKKLWADRQDVRYLGVAMRYWPWDSGWDRKQVEAMLAAGRMDLAQAYADSFSRSWPHDAEAALIRARVHEARGDLRSALDAYRRAIVKVPGGRCNPAGYEGYKAFIARPEVQRDPSLRLGAGELAACLQ